MAKRELSSTLKNLKFMQRAVQKRDEAKREEEKLDDKFVSTSTLNRKCIVIMEGNPHPGALKGRMSFQSFNPSIDKLNDEAHVSQHQGSESSSEQDTNMSDSPNGFSRVGEGGPKIAGTSNHSDIDHKRKQPEINTMTQTPDTERGSNGGGDAQSSKNRRGSYQQPKRDKLDWNLLRPPKPQAKRG